MTSGDDGFSQYCERLAGGFWAEPVNALTNIAFAVAAVMAARALGRVEGARTTWDLWLLVLLIGCIAAGSFLWHTLARPWASAADVVPILLFVSIYLVSFLVRVAGLGVGMALGVLTVFEMANFGLPALMPGALNGSIGYVPTWLGLGLLAAWSWRRAPATGRLLAGASGVFTLSVLLRSVDRSICAVLPVGTHFAWHLLNAVVLYLAVRALLPGDGEGRGGAR